jgi:hypothetical protein
MDNREAQERHLRLRRLAWLLDYSISIPGTRITFGVDALIGLIPVVGDFIGAILSTYILSEAARLGAPKSVLLRMAANIGAESLLGVVPFVGDLFDAAWKANRRNVRLLENWLAHQKHLGGASPRLSRMLLFLTFLFIVLFGTAIALWLYRTLNPA